MSSSDVVSPSVKPDGSAQDAQDAKNRRLYRRYAIAVPAELALGDTRFECAITDLSLGGAAIIPGHLAWADQEIRLHCEDFLFDDGMTGRVVRVTEEGAHIKFDLDDDMEGALTMFLVMSPATR